MIAALDTGLTVGGLLLVIVVVLLILFIARRL
jgi:hypothetical protein